MTRPTIPSKATTSSSTRAPLPTSDRSTLLATQTLFGQDATTTIAGAGSLSGIMPPAGSSPIPTSNSGNATIVTITSTGATNSVNLGANNTLRGFTLGDAGATALNSGAGFGTLTLAASGSEDVRIDTSLSGGNGQAINLNTGIVSGNFVQCDVQQRYQ